MRSARSIPRDPTTPAIVVVASRQDEMDVDAGNRAGVTDWLLWPFKETYARTRMQSWVLREPCRWSAAPLPENEARRLDALYALNVLDTPPEERFDRYTRIAAELFDVPIAFVSLIDSDRQWFKSRLGLDVSETPRDVAFCAHTILDNAVLQVPDALQDARFADNPFVTGPARVRFYAGAPLAAADGSVLGSLCVVDRRPRQLDEQQLTLLRDLADLVADRAHIRRQPVRAEARRPHQLDAERLRRAPFRQAPRGVPGVLPVPFGFQLNIGRWCDIALSGSGPRMAERSFVEEVKKLRLGAGEVFRGEGILAVTKALLESGVSYVAGYQGAPISHLMDVLADAEDILVEHGIRFENSASEATAAATLAASVNYPLRGAVTFKGPVGVNVASDALANLASGGVNGGALVIVGEDYGEGSSIMQERTHAFAMKSQIWLLDPRPNLPSMVAAVKNGFALSEASHTPVMLMLRIRACHVHGRFVAEDEPHGRLPAAGRARRAASRHGAHRAAAGDLRARAGEDPGALAGGAAVHRGERASTSSSPARPGSTTSASSSRAATTTRSCARSSGSALPTSTAARRSRSTSSTSPIRSSPRELTRFCAGKRAVLLVEEGQPNFIEQNLATILRQADLQTALHGKDMLAPAGEYTGAEVLKGTRAFLERYGKVEPEAKPVRAPKVIPLAEERPLAEVVHGRPPGFCTGCPERPIFSAMKLVERELGRAPRQRRHRLPPVLDPAAVPHRQHDDGLRARHRGRIGVQRRGAARRSGRSSMMGDGGFWHNGLTSGIANAVFNRSDNLTIVVDNNYTSATGGQDLLSSKGPHAKRSTGHAIEQAVRGVGVEWVRTIRRTYDVAGMRDALREALTTKEKGPKVLIAQSECQLNRQRRIKPLVKQAIAEGEARRARALRRRLRTPAPATTRASASRAARRSRSSRTRTRCAPIRSRPCSTAASAAASAARSRTPPCSARRSTRRASSPTRPRGTASPSACAAR